ncbi:hypothetical protein Halru_2639 [Halovivax ruber XH-70]|uniref:Uncharacterized protein n=1 Tax=Halovivax ruber (strain DSM 18193 / JCM 13892 / XH-70) TaxID=797302 RepID=L0IG63_HALRX|nr:hypothetical protein Halru_2639 [Halovivax ruber XH-70]
MVDELATPGCAVTERQHGWVDRRFVVGSTDE